VAKSRLNPAFYRRREHRVPACFIDLPTSRRLGSARPVQGALTISRALSELRDKIGEFNELLQGRLPSLLNDSTAGEA
jgi:hypothetical protein